MKLSSQGPVPSPGLYSSRVPAPSIPVPEPAADATYQSSSRSRGPGNSSDSSSRGSIQSLCISTTSSSSSSRPSGGSSSSSMQSLRISAASSNSSRTSRSSSSSRHHHTEASSSSGATAAYNSTRGCGRDSSSRVSCSSHSSSIGSSSNMRSYSSFSSSSSSRPVVAVAMSGGVDSSVAAWLLKQQGLEVFGVYMHNWDSGDEAGAGQLVCTSERDLADAKAVAKQLGMPLYEADFVGKYWTLVFEEFLAGLAQGLTPNPDLACNSYIKFGALMEFARRKGADVLATGHYARLEGAMYSLARADSNRSGGESFVTRSRSDAGSRHGVAGTMTGGSRSTCSLKTTSSSSSSSTREELQPGMARLLRGVDHEKDQSYFLAGVAGSQLYQAMFPVGEFLHSEDANHAYLAASLQACTLHVVRVTCRSQLCLDLGKPCHFGLFCMIESVKRTTSAAL